MNNFLVSECNLVDELVRLINHPSRRTEQTYFRSLELLDAYGCVCAVSGKDAATKVVIKLLDNEEIQILKEIHNHENLDCECKSSTLN